VVGVSTDGGVGKVRRDEEGVEGRLREIEEGILVVRGGEEGGWGGGWGEGGGVGRGVKEGGAAWGLDGVVGGMKQHGVRTA